MKAKIIFLVLTLALVSMACSISFNVPRTPTGELTTFKIDEKAAASNQAMTVDLHVGAAELNVTDGAAGLLEGQIVYNNPDWKPQVDRTADLLTIGQKGMDDLNFLPGRDSRNEWDLKIGANPMDLTIHAGAYKGKIDLSNYAITNFSVNDGASDSEVAFKGPNKAEMSSLVYKTGASKVELTGLANANFEEMSFDCGAGSYTLDFSGDLKRDAHVTIKSGVSNIEIFIPRGVKSKVNLQGGLNNVDLEGTWTSSNQTYTTEGNGHTLTIDIDMGVGNVRLTSK
jgi:hypothetical protein